MTSKRTPTAGKARAASSVSAGPAPVQTTRSYGPTPTKRTSVPTPGRIIREAPRQPVRPSADAAAHRRARQKAEEAEHAGLDQVNRNIDGEDGSGDDGVVDSHGQGTGVVARVRPRPSDEMQKRRAARKARGVVDHGFDKRLGLDERVLDTQNYAYYWATSDQVARLEGREYEVVPPDDLKGQELARHAGLDRNDKPQQQVLMRKWKQWDDEDRRERLKLNKEQDEALLRGNAKALKDGAQGGADYIPEGNSMSVEERTH